MKRSILALWIQEGGHFISAFVRSRPIRLKVKAEAPELTLTAKAIEPEVDNSKKAKEIATGCVPCSIGHLATCTGLLNEAMRFARSDGVESSEVIDRVNMCMDELNALERVDLRPEMIGELQSWEKSLAEHALNTSRSARHSLEGLKTASDLEKAAAETQTARQEIGREWFRQRLAKMPKEEKRKLAQKAIAKLEEE